MADIATMFHWSLDTMDRLTIDELMRWHALALERASTIFGRQ